MPADLQALDPRSFYPSTPTKATASESAPRNELQQDADGDDEDDEEPKLKYAKLTGSLANVYRNGDSTSAFTIAGDKTILGTHNGNVHILSLPSLQPLRTYHAHSATITCISVSPPQSVQPGARQLDAATASATANPLTPRAPLSRSVSTLSVPSTSTPPSKSSPQARPAPPRHTQSTMPTTPSNAVWTATSSLDGHVCVQSLVDSKDVTLRNFARPVSAVALSPEYKDDRTYLSAGLAGQLIVTQGGEKGKEQDANTNSAAAAASGWLGSFGLGSGSGSDRVLHSGEGSISCIQWSRSGKWVAWVNEEGIKIMRSHLKLGSEESEDAWRRIAHVAKPNRKSWQDMSGVWKARAEWVDEKSLEQDDEDPPIAAPGVAAFANGTNGTVKSASTPKKPKKAEKLVVGWGDMAWVLHVHSGAGFTMSSGAKQVGSADIVHKLQFRDCIVSGISLYTPTIIAILAYRTRDDDDQPIAVPDAVEGTPRKGRHRHTSLAPQLRLVHAVNGEEIDVDELPISRFETLSAQDYHLSTMHIPPALSTKPIHEQQLTGRGALEAVWAASGGEYASRIFTSGASVLSGGSSEKDSASVLNGASSFASPKPDNARGVTPTPPRISKPAVEAHPYAASAGLKMFIHSPYDCALAVKRDLSDHFEWLAEHEQYAEAWTLIDEHPECVDTSSADRHSTSSQPSTPSKAGHGSLADFFAEDSASVTTISAAAKTQYAAVEKEKRHFGDLWLQQLVADGKWEQAGRVAGKVLGTSSRWEHWVWTFAQADRFDEITPYIPATTLIGDDDGAERVLPSLVYEVVLGHYIQKDVPRLRELLELWDPALFDVRSVITAIESRLENHEVGEDTVEGGVQGRDWRILTESLAKLYVAAGRDREALTCYIRAQNADAAMALIKDGNLLDAMADDIPGFLMLRVSKEQLARAPLPELEEASLEAVNLLVEEAHHGNILPIAVIHQLERRGPQFERFLFLYLRQLWRGPAIDKDEDVPHRKFNRQLEESHALVEDHPDLAVQLFAEYDRDLLMTYLRASSVYSYEKAAQICEQRHYIPELVYILGKTGQTKRALFLIIGELGDVKQAIEFAKENGELWDDLLDYSMDKPSFIRALLEEVGTAINPIQLVRRIPEGLEIDGLKDGVVRMMREYDIQKSISEGVAKVLRGEVAVGMDTLRAGQKKAMSFEVVRESAKVIDLSVVDPPTRVDGKEALPVAKRKVEIKRVKPGHCVGCGEPFNEQEKEILIGFACGHVYHLSCLLKANPDPYQDRAIELLQSQLGSSASDEVYTGRSVGAKVAHAQVIKNVLRGGCMHCVIPDGA